jgi:methylated-DNA-protein-cysteine methyltransferase-like protein
MTEFQQAVLDTVREIPKGKIASYGQIAAYVGLPRAARQVGWAMRQIQADKFPWWRVINSVGRISIKGNISASADLQKSFLEDEGVKVSDDLKIDIASYRWCVDEKVLENLKLPNSYLEKVTSRLPFE